MSLSDQLSMLAEKVEVLEARQMDFDDLINENRHLRHEIDWLHGIMEDFGINIDANLSVADVMAIEKALQITKVL